MYTLAGFVLMAASITEVLNLNSLKGDPFYGKATQYSCYYIAALVALWVLIKLSAILSFVICPSSLLALLKKTKG